MGANLKRILTLLLITLFINTLGASADYVGSGKSSIYHYRDCEWAVKINPANQIVFEDADAAQKAGFRSCKVCLPPESGKISQMWLDNPPQNLNVGEFAALKWKYIPENPEDKDKVKVEITNKDVARLTGDKIYAKAVGSTDIVASTPGGISYTYTLHVVPVPVDKVYVVNPPKSVAQFESFCPEVKVEPANTGYKEVTWKTSDKSVVKVTKNGKLKAVGVGKCKITAVCGGKKHVFEIEVKRNLLIWLIPGLIVLGVVLFIMKKKK